MLEIDIAYNIEKNEDYLIDENIIEYVENILKNEKENFNDKTFYISLLITNNEEIHEINKQYRNMDRPTDVISFAYNETENVGPIEVVGDIIISIDKVKSQASEFGHPEKESSTIY